MSKTQPLHILRLEITNYGIIKVAAIDPDNGNPVVLAGDNGNGKSTALNAIESVLLGRKLAEPVTHGKDKAEIALELAEAGSSKMKYRIEQIIKKGDDGTATYNLKVYDQQKKQVPKPAQFIADLMASGAALDPTEIMLQRPGERPETFAKRQAETLLERLGLKKKVSDLDEAIKEKESERKTANAEVERLRVRREGIKVPDNAPDKEIDVAELGSKISEFNNILSEHSRQKEKLQTAEGTLQRAKDEVTKAEKALKTAQEAMGTALKARDGIQETINHFEDMNPEAAVRKSLVKAQESLSTANQTNAGVAKKLERKKVSDELLEAQAKANDLEGHLSTLREDRLDIVRNAKLPVKGLKLTEDALLYNGKPLIQESTGNQWRVCAALATSEPANCRVLFIREGALINKENRKIIYEVAIQNGYQVWEEHFSEQPLDGALWIEGGKVVEK